MLIIGNNIFSIRVAKLLNVQVLNDWKSLLMLFIERKVLFIGLGFSPSTGWKRFLLLLICLFLRRNIYGYFIGSDLLRFKSSSSSQLIYRIIQRKIEIFVETDEMEEVAVNNGINVSRVQTYQTISSEFIQQTKIIKNDNVIAAYVGQKNQSFYRIEKILEAAHQLSSFKFIIIGDAPDDKLIPSNTSFTGWVDDMQSIYSLASVFIRIPLSDGLGLSAYEALSRGCNVITSTNKPHCFLYSPEKDLALQIKTTYTMQVDFDAVNKFVNEKFSEKKVKYQLSEMLGL